MSLKQDLSKSKWLQKIAITSSTFLEKEVDDLLLKLSSYFK